MFAIAKSLLFFRVVSPSLIYSHHVIKEFPKSKEYLMEISKSKNILHKELTSEILQVELKRKNKLTSKEKQNYR